MSPCAECGSQLGYWSRRECPAAAGGCGRTVCGSCRDYALVTEEEARQGPKARVASLCKACFRRHSSLDLTVTEEVLGPAAGEAPALVYVHGGGGCRLMFREHAAAMSARGLRCVLMDLPGHGARMDEPLSMESAIQAIQETIKVHAPPCRGIKPIYVGGSLGGYIGMEFLGRHPDAVSGAIIAMCGQNVGVGRGVAASFGLSAMNSCVGMLGQATLLKGLMAEVRKNGHVSQECLNEIALRPGMFFRQGKEQIAILRQTNPREALVRFKEPVLFANGSRDHRDSEEVWKAAAEKGTLLVYEGGDHFFSHDSRYSGRFIQDSWNFIDRVVKGLEASQ